MSHEHSETIQDEAGNWVNVFGRDTGNAGSRLPGMPSYATVGEADAAAAARSRGFHGSEAPLDVQRYWERSYTPPVKENPMPGLSSYQYQGLSARPEDSVDPRNPAFASNQLSNQDNQNLDTMLQRLDSGAAAPANMGESRATMPQPAAQSNPWLEWLMKYLQGQR